MTTIANPDDNRILAVDVAYQDDRAVVAGVLFQHWNDSESDCELKIQVNNVEAYIPGQFFRRELPCILALLRQMTALPNIIVVDGYVYLGNEHRAGLGQHLYEALHKEVAIIGVAKKPFQDTPTKSAIFRGTSQKPLYVTAVGIDEAVARNHIVTMHGKYRIPTLLKRVDQLTRQV